MSRLLLVVAIAAIVLLVGAFVPVGGKTLVERWNGASAVRPVARGPGSAPSPSRPGAAAGTPARRPTAAPVEHHTEADRSAIDRIVAEHAAEPPAARP